MTLGALDGVDHHLAVMQGGAAGKWEWGLDVEEEEEASLAAGGGGGGGGGGGAGVTGGVGLGGLSDSMFASLNYGTSRAGHGASEPAAGSAPSASPRRFV